MTSTPFVLLDDARDGGAAWLYRDPVEIVETRDLADVSACLERLRGRHAAGFLSYEAGCAFEDKLRPLAEAPAGEAPSLLWFGLFERAEPVNAAALLPDPAGAYAASARPLIAEADYRAAIARVLEHIAAGDIYQANLTFQAEVKVLGDPLALYAAIRSRARAGHGGIVFTGTHWLLSFSPELFFTMTEGRVTTRPMKGTAPAGSNPDALRTDPKQRAENLMIVDLLRNDLSRLAKPGTVEVPELFAVEAYPTVLQMTSTITAELEDGKDPIDLLHAIYPCGSITGAPKIRAMEIIHDVEAGPRGAYTGVIGRVAPDGEAAFNVAIRTLTLRAGGTVARLGLGSGIVADSRADEEWRECLAKGVFVATTRRFDLIETMAFDPHVGIADLDRHLARMKRSAEAFGFPFDRHEARNELQAATFRAGPSLVRLLASSTGAMAIELRPLPAAPAGAVAVAVVPRPVASEDFRLRHKTTDRAFYDEARVRAGRFDVLFRDSGGFLTEGSFTSLFVERAGRLLTPPLTRGLLPGILRERLIAEGRAGEADLTEADLTGGFFIGNAVRGLIPAVLASAG
ncbi:aminodeoxychorismate synthase component I [Sphingosinicella sp. LHD-64]|uniref:aminodeoxychorismate synthase component I n=1 Tax=Sphingosinicella sp. LHD-64 TaxID=3072139 RepID=UPI0028106589|nr:aminodeoxychorismate synthase component I [Sphingosinicella sp. LHD-64]MDQ8756857.1 aminodeoxychorismate synthase component I [Sphingosinicella sp. LHD-64]